MCLNVVGNGNAAAGRLPNLREGVRMKSFRKVGIIAASLVVAGVIWMVLMAIIANA
jgi:hypothetical protein